MYNKSEIMPNTNTKHRTQLTLDTTTNVLSESFVTVATIQKQTIAHRIPAIASVIAIAENPCNALTDVCADSGFVQSQNLRRDWQK
eukprot:TRINITY_DN16707_c0_g1_i1.p1 TRINITY_DN16707_c0_g1~~TRINITY_DN16707_c0_g1_i1.p1  ORF type:complete len:86 (-),score=2.81 TRINITY_DN16707_c0_g1_i1:242-499(-)